MYNKNLGYIIIETATTDNDYPSKIISEDKLTGRPIGEGILQRADKRNRNSRYYSKEELFPQVTSPRTIELIRTGNMRAENGHPLSKDLVRQQTIDPDKTTAIFLKMWVEGDYVWGRYTGTNNSRGEEFNKDLLCGYSPSWSLRALGRVVETARGAEVRGIKLITYDRVIYPSHEEAYNQRLVSESASLIQESGNKLLLEETDSGLVIPITNDSVTSYLKAESANLRVACESLEFMYNNIEIIENATQVKLTNDNGEILVVNLESYIHDEIMNSCIDFANRR